MMNKPLLRFAIIALAVIAVAAIVGSFTFLNKRWWAKRIEKRWPDAEGMSTNDVLLRETSLARLIEIYNNGGGILFTSSDGTPAAPALT